MLDVQAFLLSCGFTALPGARPVQTARPGALFLTTDRQTRCRTAIDANTHTVTARENSTGKMFQFKVTNAALLNSLKVGQGVYANFAASQVSVVNGAPCCNIVGMHP